MNKHPEHTTDHSGPEHLDKTELEIGASTTINLLESDTSQSVQTKYGLKFVGKTQ